MNNHQKKSAQVFNGSLFLFTLRRHRMLLIIISLCAAAYSLVMVGLWPLFTDASMQEMMEVLAASIPGFDTEAFSMSVGEYLDTQWLGVYWLPLAGAVMIAMAAKGIAGNVNDGTLETIASYPVARTSYLNTLIAALCVIALILSLATIIPIALAGPAFEIELKVGTIIILILASWLILFVFGLFTLAISAWTRGMSASVGIVVGILVVMMVLLVATPFVSQLEILQPFNLLHWWGSASLIDTGEAKSGLWIYLGVVGVASLICSYAGFLRRDLT